MDRRSSQSVSFYRLRRCGEPVRRLRIDARGQHRTNLGMIGVEPGDLVVIEQRGLDQVAVDRGQSQGLEAQHFALGRAVRGLHQDEIFDPDAKTFRTLTQPAVPLVVRPTAPATPTGFANSQGRSENSPSQGHDIVPNKQRLGTVGQITFPLVQQTWFLSLQSVPLLVFVSS